MVRLLLFASLLLSVGLAWAQADNRTIIGGGNEHLVAVRSQPACTRVHAARNAADVREIGVGHHQDVHGESP